jgi:hypothetical protein
VFVRNLTPVEIAEAMKAGTNGDISVTGGLEDRPPSPLDERIVLKATA